MDQVDEVKSRVDIVEVISSYIPLKKAGRNLSGLCPFHSEKTPSFMVSADRQVFKCFGCGESGDVFTFLEKIEGWEFKETLEELAKRAGVTLKQNFSSERSKTKEKLIDIHKLASKFYNHLLLNHPVGEEARKYLEAREIGKEMWELFGLGYAPNNWENVFDLLKKRKFDISDIATSGLVVARSGRNANSYYDRFRNRLMFPLRDTKGEIVGFSGRVIGESKDGPKYLNSPQTPIFEKGALLFGLFQGKSEIKSKNEAILVEGEFDVISPFEAGIKNVVASKGTALTERQVATLSRLCENVSLCYDMDIAGDVASRRGIELLDTAGVNVKVVDLGRYKDPDEFARSDKKGLVKAISTASNIYDYFIESAISRFDSKTAQGKKKIGSEVIPVISKISDDLVRAHYIDKLSKVLDLDVSLIQDAVNKKVVTLVVDEQSIGTVKKSGGIGLGEYFLALLIARDEIFIDAVWDLSADDFEDLDQRRFYKWLRGIIGDSKSGNLKKLLARLPVELEEFVNNLYLVNISPIFLEKEVWAVELIKVATRIKTNSFQRQMKAISEEIKLAEAKGNLGKVKKLTETLAKVDGKLFENLKGLES